MGFGLGVQGLGDSAFRVWGLGFGVQGLGFRGARMQGVGLGFLLESSSLLFDSPLGSTF